MHASLLTILSAVAAVNAFTIPEEMGDGIFLAHEGSNKAELLAPIEKRDISTTEASSEKRDLPISEYNCYNGEDLLDGVNYEQAKAHLISECENYDIPGGSSIVARVGSVAVYGCSWGGSNPCGEEEITEVMSKINDECGNLQGGDAWMQDWAKIYGRGRAWDGFCENA